MLKAMDVFFLQRDWAGNIPQVFEGLLILRAVDDVCTRLNIGHCQTVQTSLWPDGSSRSSIECLPARTILPDSTSIVPS